MDLDSAIHTHVCWHAILTNAIAERGRLSEIMIAMDNQCDLGRWLHGEGNKHYAHLASYHTCLALHAAFHQCAGEVAALINASDYARAEAMIEFGSPYLDISAALIRTLRAIKTETRSSSGQCSFSRDLPSRATL